MALLLPCPAVGAGIPCCSYRQALAGHYPRAGSSPSPRAADGAGCGGRRPRHGRRDRDGHVTEVAERWVVDTDVTKGRGTA